MRIFLCPKLAIPSAALSPASSKHTPLCLITHARIARESRSFASKIVTVSFSSPRRTKA